MIFHKHPFSDKLKEFQEALYSRVSKYSFLILKEPEGYSTSWQDQEKGGSASNTIEGPFKTLTEAKENCRRIFKQLLRKN